MLKEGIRQIVKSNIKKLPESLVDNDYKIDWSFGDVYTLEPLKGYILNYGSFAVLYQELEVIRFDENGKKVVVGETVYTRIIEDELLVNLLDEYEEVVGNTTVGLMDILYYEVDSKIKEFGEGYIYRGCEFLTNEEEFILTEEEFILEFVRRFRKNLSSFFTDILVKKDFTDGIYRIKITMAEVGYQDDVGWGVMLGVEVQNFQTLEKTELDLLYTTNIKRSRETPSVSLLREYVYKELEDFVAKNRVSQHLGVEFRFLDFKGKEFSIYRKIIGEEDEFVYWSERYRKVLEGHKENLSEIIQGIKSKEGVGYVILTKEGRKLVFSVGGIMTYEGQDVYIKGEMNLQEGLRNLVKYLGRNKVTLDLIKMYDYRTRVKEVDKHG